jgi:hypothetical protein
VVFCFAYSVVICVGVGEGMRVWCGVAWRGVSILGEVRWPVAVSPAGHSRFSISVAWEGGREGGRDEGVGGDVVTAITRGWMDSSIATMEGFGIFRGTPHR